MGLLAPGTPFAPQRAGPSGLSSSVLRPGHLVAPSGPLLGFGPPTRSLPKSPLAGLPALRAPSPGVLLPYSVSGSRSPRPRHRKVAGLPGWSGAPPAAPNRRLRCRSQVFSTSQRPCSSRSRPAIFRRVTLMGFALQGFVPPAKPDSSSLPACPLDVAPVGCAHRTCLAGGHGRALQAVA
jgi:hypothetical protein